MRIDLHIHCIGMDEISSQLLKGMKKMSASLDRLTREVAESRETNASVLALIAGLAQEIRDNVSDEAALEALADDLDAQQGELAAAVSENTPAAEEPAPAPEPEEPAPTGEGTDGQA